MYRHRINAVLLSALLSIPAHAQIVIPDIQSSIVRIPPPNSSQSQGSSAGRSAGDDQRASAPDRAQPAPDARCSRLPPSLRNSTPGCRP